MKTMTHSCFLTVFFWQGCSAIHREFLQAQAAPPATLKCVGFKKTLKCDPSGPREPLKDKDCATVVTSEESGYCECGDYKKLNTTSVQFAAVACTHPPFRCDEMCLKLSEISGVSIEYKGATLDPAGAKAALAKTQKNPFDIGPLKQAVNPPPMPAAVVAYVKKASADLEKHNTATMKHAEAAQKAVDDLMKQNSRAWADVDIMKKNLMFPGGEPVWKTLGAAARKMTEAGQKIQATVKKVIPWDPLAGPSPFAPPTTPPPPPPPPTMYPMAGSLYR